MKKAASVFIAATMAIALLAGCGGQAAGGQGTTSTAGKGTAASQIISLGTGSVGGTDNVVVEAMSSVVNKVTGLKTSTVTTSGGVEIIHLLESGDIQGGYAGTIDLINAKNGTGTFDHKIAEDKMLQCLGFVTWNLPVVVLDNSPIKSYEDLAGHRIGFPPIGSSSTDVLNVVLEQYGLKDKVTVDYFTWNEGYTALKDGRIDAFVGSYANGMPISGLIEVEATSKIRLLNMDAEVGKKVAAANEGIGISALSHGQVPAVPEGQDCLSAANSGVLIFSSAVPEDVVYQYTKTVIDNIGDLKKITAYLEAFDTTATGVCVKTVPFHPGAAKALKEAGLWQDDFVVFGA